MSAPILALSPLFHDLGAIAAIAAAALLVGWVQRHRPLVQYLFFLRFPLLLVMLLVLLPVLGGDPDSTMLRNLFVLDARGITWATWVTLMAAWVVAATAGLIGRLAPERFGTAPFRLPRVLGWLAGGVSSRRLFSPHPRSGARGPSRQSGRGGGSRRSSSA